MAQRTMLRENLASENEICWVRRMIEQQLKLVYQSESFT